MRTDSIELNVFTAQVLSSQVNVILRFAVGDQHSNLSGVGSHAHVLFEIVLEDVVESHACNGSLDERRRQRSGTCATLTGMCEDLSWCFLLCRGGSPRRPAERPSLGGRSNAIRSLGRRCTEPDLKHPPRNICSNGF